MRTLFFCFVIGLVMLVAGTISAQTLEKLTLATGNRLNENELLPRETSGPLDALRVGMGETLVLKSRAYENGEYGVTLARQGSANLQATLTVTRASAKACSGYTNYARSRLILAAFNTTGYGAAGVATNDVRAIVELQRSSAQTGGDKTLAINYHVLQCLDATCATSTALATGGLGMATIGAPVTLNIAWEEAANRFVFTKDPGTTTAATAYGNYSVSDAYTPGNDEDAVAIEHVVTPCDSKADSRVHLAVKDVGVGEQWKK